jgi:tetratricopeptide (TPR) repeat protein
MIRIKFFAIFILINSFVFSQEDYEILYIKGEYEKVLQNSMDLDSPNDYYWNSLILDRKGDDLKAIEILRDGLNKYANNHMLEKLLIDLLYKTGQYGQAKSLLSEYLDSPDIFLKFINILGFEGEYQMAINYLKEKIKTDSLNIEYLSLLGDYYNQIDSLSFSINALEKLITLSPNDLKNLNKLANLYIRNKNYIKAIRICDRVLVNDTINKKFIRIKGIAGFNNDNFDIAGNCFKMLLDQGDSGKFVLKHLGVSEFRNSMFKESREHLLMAYQVDSNDFEINYFLGKAYLNSPTAETGLYYLNRVDSLLQPDPKIISALYYDKQSIYSAIGNYSGALKSYEMAYKYDAKPEYIFYIASLYQHKLENKMKALEYYERFLTLLPPKPESEHKYDEKQITVSLRKAAETNIIELKEELFFKGELNK